MKTDKITIFNLFDNQRRYLVPIFQRGYVWNKDGQWAPLWEDILDQTNLLHSQKEASQSTIRKHFLGAIVLNQVPTVIKQVSTSEIIDGQQRLLTLQIFLAAFRDSIVSLGDDYLNVQLERLTTNPEPLNNVEDKYKVWPTNAYQNDLKSIMNARSLDNLIALYPQQLKRRKLIPPRPALVEAYIFFHNMVVRYLNALDEDSYLSSANMDKGVVQKERANLLYEAVRNYVQIVEIQLDAEDDPQVIFETLNYRGVPLEPSDLIRNYIFLSANRQRKNVDELYNKWWKDYDETKGKNGYFWKEKERQGRLTRSRLDLFFFHYLTFRIGHEIKISHLYQEFKDWWEQSPRSMENELEKVMLSSKVFRTLLACDEASKLSILAHRLKVLDTTTAYPFLIWLCENEDKISSSEFEGILNIIESYLIRRAVCRLTPKNYNRIFVNLLNKLSKDKQFPNRESLCGELLSLEGESAVWPNDEMFTKSLVYDPIYDSIGPNKVRMILTALELASRSSKQEVELAPISISNSLTVEHIMPQGYRPEEWPLPFPISEAADKQMQLAQRNVLLHSIGNLTLLTQALNSSISNGPFNLKRPEITSQGLLLLNNFFHQYSYNDIWDENEIIKRGKQLSLLAIKVWPFPPPVKV